MTIWVELDKRRYPIVIQTDLLPRVQDWVPPGAKIAVITHPELLHYAHVISENPICIPSGERYKRPDTVVKIVTELLRRNLERGDCVVVVGGGVLGDMAGFAASVFLRGIAVIQIPTTLLAQVDAAIGGKTGVNHPLGKNLMGTFHQPKAVLIDLSTLATLPKRELRCGLAEIVKYGVIRDPDLFHFLEENSDKIALLTPLDHLDIWRHLVVRSCINKAEIVSTDETEHGQREILNFGHTIGHAIETVFGYNTYLHGEAVALGMVAATDIALNKGAPASILYRLVHLLKKLGFSLTLQKCSIKKILAIMAHDKKVKQEKIRFILPLTIGSTWVDDTCSNDEISTTLLHLMNGRYDEKFNGQI